MTTDRPPATVNAGGWEVAAHRLPSSGALALFLEENGLTDPPPADLKSYGFHCDDAAAASALAAELRAANTVFSTATDFAAPVTATIRTGRDHTGPVTFTASTPSEAVALELLFSTAADLVQNADRLAQHLPPADPPACQHGPRVHKTGSNERGPWSGWFCPLGQERAADRCAPVFAP
jgi:hypothetical protein